MSTILLVVDDEPDVQLLMKQKFRKEIKNEEYEFVFAANGVEALEVLKQNPEIEVVLCDVNMPQMDGITLLSKVRKINPTAQTVIVSAYGDMRNIRRAMNHGAFDFVTKPINFNDLGATIDKTIRYVKKVKEDIQEKEQLYHRLEEYNKELEEKVQERTLEITKQKEIIEAKNQSITESINYAKRIQQATLPRLEEIKKAIPESFVFFRPRDIVSGDFYWFQEEENKYILAAADCTGHGVPGAFMSLIGNDLLNVIVKARKITQPDKILAELHIGVRSALRQDDTHGREGMDISICTIDFNKNVLQFAAAKNPLLYVRNGKAEVIKGDKFPVGGIQQQGPRDFTLHEIPLTDEPLTCYLYSDGYQDQFGGKEGMKFMSKNFREMLIETAEKPMSDQQQAIAQTFEAWRGGRPQIDDILVVGLKLQKR